VPLNVLAPVLVRLNCIRRVLPTATFPNPSSGVLSAQAGQKEHELPSPPYGDPDAAHSLCVICTHPEGVQQAPKATPNPCADTFVAQPVVIVVDAGPADPAKNLTPTCTLWSWARLCAPPFVTTGKYSGHCDATFTDRMPYPVLVIVKYCCPDSDPTGRTPKSRLTGLTEHTGGSGAVTTMIRKPFTRQVFEVALVG